MKIFDDSMSVGKTGFNRARERKEGWTEGVVATPWGFVTVYAQGDEKYMHSTRLDFIHGGRLHMRNFTGKRYSVRGIKTQAMRFAAEISGAPQ